jgi:omega-6 fatty acid desaturase (delta-12 desaturase)
MTATLASPGVAECKAIMPADRRLRSVRRGMQVFAAVSVAWIMVFASSLAAPTWPLKVIAGAALGFALGISFVVGHDACHGALTPNNKLNEWVARIAFGPPLHPFSSWDYSHNVLHHGWTNLRGRDPAYAPFTKAEYDALPLRRRVLERVYRSMLGVALYYFIEIWWRVEMFPSEPHRKKIDRRGSFRFDRNFVIAFGSAEVLMVLALAKVPGGGSRYELATIASLVAVSIVWPYAVFHWMLGFFTFQQHTHPTVSWYDDHKQWSFYKGQVQGTVHIQFPWLVEVLLNNIMNHTAHHVDPKIPMYNLVASQQALEEAFGDNVVVERWTPMTYYRLFTICRLYDYDSRRWIGYNGVPTSSVTTRTA